MLTTRDTGDMLSLDDLQKIIMMVKAIPKLDATFKATIEGMTMKTWLEVIKKKGEREVIFDKKSFIAAAQSIIDLDKDQLKHCETDVDGLGPELEVLLDGGCFKLNHIQLATTVIAYQNTKLQQHQMWVVPAG